MNTKPYYFQGMTKPKRILTQLSMACLPVVMAQPGLAIELTDYTEPLSQYESAYVSGQMNVDSGNQDQTSFDIKGNGNYENIFSSADRIVSFELDANLDSSRSGIANADTLTGYDVFGTAQTREYFNNQNNTFWYGAADLGFRRLQGSGENDDPFLKISAGLGMGRVTNATPLALVMRVVEVFQEHGIMQSEPSDAVYLELASVIAREQEYISNHGSEEYNQFWFKDLETILVREGLIEGDTLSAVAVLKMDNILVDERISTRAHGWFLQGGVGYIASDYVGEDGDPTLDVLFQYAKPYGINTQFIQELSYSTVLADDTNQLFSSVSSLTYEMSDRVDWENGIDLSLTVFGADGAPNVFLAEAFTTYRYYISNRLSADLTFALSHVNDKVENNGNDDIGKSLFAGITYRLK